MPIMTPAMAPEIPLGIHYKSRTARDHIKDVLDAAEAGGTAIITRDRPVAAVDAKVLAELLAAQAPFNVLSSTTEDQVAFWLADGLVHGVGDDIVQATDDFLDALIDYAKSWFEDLRDAPNHAHNKLLVLRIALHSGDRDELERAVFDD
jgi:hypothetical protein